MKKDKLEKALINYSGMATALLGAHAATGQIVVNDIADVTLSKNGEVYDFNIDNDVDTANIIDFRITQFVDSSLYNLTGVTIETANVGGNQVIGMDYANYNYPFKLNFNDTINDTKPFKGLGPSSIAGKHLGYLALSVNDTTYPNSQFVGGVTDGYLGVKFQGNRNDTLRTYYGWIRLDVAADLRSVTIKEFAYNPNPNGTIYAGNIFIGSEELKANSPELVQRGEYLDISLPEDANPNAKLEFYDLGGKLVQTHNLDKLKNRFELNQLPKGVLVARVKTELADTSMKVVVY